MIKISDKYVIDADEYNFVILENKIKKKTGETYQVVVAYVTDIEQALQCIYKRESKKWVHEHDATLSTASKEFAKIAKEIREFGKKYDMKETQ